MFALSRAITLLSLCGLIISPTIQDEALEILECATNHSRLPCLEILGEKQELIRTNRSSGSYSEDRCKTSNSSNIVDRTNPSLICAPASLDNNNNEQSLQRKQPVQVYIRIPDNVTQFEPGSALTIECRFITRNPQKDFKFNLRWLRSVASSQGNQSIAATDDVDSMTIIATTTKIWTVQRGDGLDLEINEFQAGDVGSYFCQAYSAGTADEIYDEAKLDLELARASSSSLDDGQANEKNKSEQAGNAIEPDQYSQETLSKLLPSLKVFPSYAELAVGDSIQLSCLSGHLDPDPEPHHLEWTFEPIIGDRRSELLLKPPLVERDMPANTSVFSNQLMIWSMSEEHCGLYKCTVRLPEFNLTAQAVAELGLRPSDDAAPLVRVTPEFIRLPLNSSADIQCEATGYPPPELSWYRVDQPPSSVKYSHSSTTFEPPKETAWFDLDGVSLERIASRDAVAYCEHSHRCYLSSSPASADSRRSRSDVRSITGISLVHIRSALAQHQGQYVCLASNKHGSNQASSTVDVEYREPPRVSIAPGEREKTIQLMADESRTVGNITFKCTIQSGRPQPKIRWLRPSSGGGGKFKLGGGDNLDIYDLTRVSSATSKVSTWLEEDGRSLVLSISTVSLDDEGDYVCLAENEWGRHTALARLSVRKAVSVRIVQTSPIVALINSSFQLDCIAAGHPLPLDLEWSRSDVGAFFSLINRQATSQLNEERAVLKFDKASLEDSGEYTCNARDPLNSTVVLRDTIMVLVEQQPRIDNHTEPFSSWANRTQQDNQLPKLMVRPTKINALPGSNVTLDCLAVSGLQPTIVEWLAPANLVAEEYSSSSANQSSVSPYIIRPYFSSNNLQFGPLGSQLMQFGSKLRILNVSRHHEGIYQCKGRNKVGVENAPALIKLLDTESTSGGHEDGRYAASGGKSHPNVGMDSQRPTKTKVAKLGSNIELKCQVNGIEQPATSWSRDGKELPASSVQIEHNLWIQNLTIQDAGLYICSARSKLPNKVIQAKINLVVHRSYTDSPSTFQNLSAKIVASKSAVNLGSSITLECIINAPNNTNINSSDLNEFVKSSSQIDLDELESNVIWTNVHSGQSLFQANVYIQNNLLIIYQLRPENSATYRCNYNDLTQFTDYRLQLPTTDEPYSRMDYISYHNNQQTAPSHTALYKLQQVPVGSRFVIDCALDSKSVLGQPTGAGKASGYYWSKGGSVLSSNATHNNPLVFDSITSKDADLYQCHPQLQASDQQSAGSAPSLLVQVLAPVARFAQRPVSFATLPSISGADYQLDIELKFLPEREHGLLLFNGHQNRSLAGGGDYISLGLNKGHLEFRFELGDGVTLLRSSQPVGSHQWHKVLIERNRRGAVMWLDKQPPVSNSSAGKFFNLNLDSVLYVGGHQHFLAAGNGTASRSSGNGTAVQSRRNFYGYSRGFQGCIALLRISGVEINLMARNRSVSVGVFECDKSECAGSDCSLAHQQTGVCQVDRTWWSSWDATRRSSAAAELRCICSPGWRGERCDRFRGYQAPTPASVDTTTTRLPSKQAPTSRPVAATTTPQPDNGACAILKPCSANGTIECRSLTSISYKCHCQLGFTGDTCSQAALFTNETSVAFNQQAYLQLRFNKPEEMSHWVEVNNATSGVPDEAVNASNFARLSSMVEQQNISFRLQTRSSFGLLFYTGQANLFEQQPAELRMGSMNALLLNASNPSGLQTSKSMVANLLARLSSGNVILDYLAIALVDGHLELRLVGLIVI